MWPPDRSVLELHHDLETGTFADVAGRLHTAPCAGKPEEDLVHATLHTSGAVPAAHPAADAARSVLRAAGPGRS